MELGILIKYENKRFMYILVIIFLPAIIAVLALVIFLISIVINFTYKHISNKKSVWIISPKYITIFRKTFLYSTLLYLLVLVIPYIFNL